MEITLAELGKLRLAQEALCQAISATPSGYSSTRKAIAAAHRKLAADVVRASRRPLTPESQAEADGCRVHHDLYGWYVVEPGEDEPEDGYSLGFDGRDHYASEADAWCAAARGARRAA